MRGDFPLPFVEEPMGASQTEPDAPNGTLDDEVRTARFTALYDAHVVEVYQFVHRRCRDRAMAEDVTHDAFLTAVRTVDDPNTITVGWLIRVARNRMIDVLRRQNRHTDKLRLIRGQGAAAADPSEAWVDRVTVERAMDALGVEHRLVLTLHLLDGYTAPALAQELGRTVKSIERSIARAKVNLQRELRNAHG
jgi:RNA polymerase sigma-70 factor (ECF subfamily)